MVPFYYFDIRALHVLSASRYNKYNILFSSIPTHLTPFLFPYKNPKLPRFGEMSFGGCNRNMRFGNDHQQSSIFSNFIVYHVGFTEAHVGLYATRSRICIVYIKQKMQFDFFILL